MRGDDRFRAAVLGECGRRVVRSANEPERDGCRAREDGSAAVPCANALDGYGGGVGKGRMAMLLSEGQMRSMDMGEVLASGDGRSIFARVRWGRCW